MSSLFNTLKQLAVAAGVGEDTKIQFSMKPNTGESGFQQWHGAMKMVARLSGGIPHEFRKTLWLTLAERHISSKNINWSQVERTCFNDSTNPDDEELGVQIVKDLHRTGCSLFCGTSGEQNQGVLKRVLLAYARWNKLVGYCQGFNMLAALILEVMDRCEYYSLKVMIYLIEGVLPESYFVNSLRGLTIDMAVFRDLLRLKLPELSKHLDALQTDSNDAGNTYEPPLTNVFTMQWFLTLFCNCLPHSTVLRVWDLIFLEGNQMLLKTALAIWDTLSDRIMPVKSADEFYSIMGVLTREMLEFGLMDANSLIKTITSIELPELTELRERYIYNITPWTQVARKGLRLFYSDDESADSDEDQNDDKATEGAYRFLKVATKHGSQSIRNISSASILGPLANEKDKIASDISALKKQYSKMKERQRQAQIIFTAACNTQGLMGTVVSSTPAPAINHLLLNKSTSTSLKLPKNQKTTVPVSRAVQRLKESSSVSLVEDLPKERGETLYWNKRMKNKRKKRRTEINFQKNYCDTVKSNKIENYVDSDSSTTSTTSSFKSSSSTELCDEMAEFDSEDASINLNEYCSSSHHRVYSSNTVSYSNNDKFCEKSESTHTKQELPLDTSGYASSDYINEHSNLFDTNGKEILDALLTTSIITNECLNKKDDKNESIIERFQINDFFGKLDTYAEKNVCDNNLNLVDTNKNINEIFTSNNENRVQSFESITVKCENRNELTSDGADINLEHMKIDALELLFSSSTLESIQTETLNDENNDCSTAKQIPDDTDKENTTFVFQMNKDTELALRKILHENTEILKKVNQTYSSFESQILNDVDFRNEIDNFSMNYIDEDGDKEIFTNDNSTDNQNLESITNEYESFTEDGVFNDENKLEFCFVNNIKSINNKNYLEKCFFDKFVINDNIKLRDDQEDLNINDSKKYEFDLDVDGFKNNSELINLINVKTSEDNGINSNESRNSRTLEMFTFDDISNIRSTLYFNVKNNKKFETDDKNEDFKARFCCKKYKSLDSLYSKSKPKFKIGMVSRNGKWISISIDNSDLVILNNTSIDNLINNLSLSDHSKTTDEIYDFDYDVKNTTYKDVKSKINKKFEFSNRIDVMKNTEKINQTDVPKDPYLHMNFDIITTAKKKNDPIENYIRKKNILSQNYKSSDLSELNFNPFPSRPNSRAPKELGIKLGLYSSNKK